MATIIDTVTVAAPICFSVGSAQTKNKTDDGDRCGRYTDAK